MAVGGACLPMNADPPDSRPRCPNRRENGGRARGWDFTEGEGVALEIQLKNLVRPETVCGKGLKERLLANWISVSRPILDRGYSSV